ncbi:YqhV family protein [Alicyclobacillus contaminans]|uniref:YqhV family protein n=1 Tax=Alicyclobacillus contaminans TaxID=392016 RepID=UPI000406E008|nr:YqhV family protein [Alicyclobacillus contaminans]
MLHGVERVVYGMAGLRMVSSLLEMSGALMMLYFGTAARALQVNAALAMVGPLVLVTVTMLGVLGMADQISWGRIVWIVIGVGCILFGAKG